jgi:hypothetical protein
LNAITIEAAALMDAANVSMSSEPTESADARPKDPNLEDEGYRWESPR